MRENKETKIFKYYLKSEFNEICKYKNEKLEKRNKFNNQSLKQ